MSSFHGQLLTAIRVNSNRPTDSTLHATPVNTSPSDSETITASALTLLGAEAMAVFDRFLSDKPNFVSCGPVKWFQSPFLRGPTSVPVRWPSEATMSFPRPGGHWMKQDDIDGGRRAGVNTDEREELVRLRRELRTAQMEIEILRRAAAYFAKETLPGPK